MEHQGYCLEEAEKMWCPVSFAGEESLFCKSNRCMAWRWVFFEGVQHNSYGYCGMARQIPYTEIDAQDTAARFDVD